ncbi:hypothetical protein G8935_001566 [Salmonella enterica]|nr:hypothetical protein [Salmonella enterica]EEP9970211.1 hypothetical protein [Salmonella enterica]
MTVISGILKNNSGDILALTTITLTETDSKQTFVTTTDTGGNYYLSITPGTWRVTLQLPDTPPKDIGMMETDNNTQPGALENHITSLQPSTLDIQVLGFMRNLVSEAERAAEVITAGKESIKQDINASQTAAGEAKQALEEAKKIIGDGKPGRDGKSAYEIWVEQQPAGSDTSMSAYMVYQKGTPGLKGEPGADGKSAYEIWVEQQPAGSDTSMAAYMAYQKGKPGADGKSAYDIWAAQQPAGSDVTLEAFMNTLTAGDIVLTSPDADDPDNMDPRTEGVCFIEQLSNVPGLEGKPAVLRQIRCYGKIFQIVISGRGVNWRENSIDPSTGAVNFGSWGIPAGGNDRQYTGDQYEPGDYILGWPDTLYDGQYEADGSIISPLHPTGTWLRRGAVSSGVTGGPEITLYVRIY